MRNLILFLLIHLLSSCITEREADVQEFIQPGMTLPPFSVTLSDGTPCTPDSLKGAPCLLAFFRTTCSDCQRELPVLQTFYEEYALPRGIRVVAIGREESSATVLAYWQEQHFTMPVSPQPDRKIFSLFASQGVPRLYLCNPKGMVTHVFNDSSHLTPERLINAFTAQ